MLPLQRLALAPVDLADALKTVPPHAGYAALSHGHEWIHAQRYLDWASADLATGDERGWSNAISNCKRAVCRRIDELLFANQLDSLLGKDYPRKLEALEEVGAAGPSIVHELVIDPRNELEHQYAQFDEMAAKKALQVANLYVRATAVIGHGDALPRWRAVLFGGTPSYSQSQTGDAFHFHDPPKHPILFVDVFDNEHSIRIINLHRREIMECDLLQLPRAVAVQFGLWCRKADRSYYPLSANAIGLFKSSVGLL